MNIQEFITERMETGKYQRQYELAMELGLNSAQLSHYNTGRSKQPTINVAKIIYDKYEVVVWPYAEKALKELYNG